jgi:hypothetical protein
MEILRYLPILFLILLVVAAICYTLQPMWFLMQEEIEENAESLVFSSKAKGCQVYRIEAGGRVFLVNTCGGVAEVAPRPKTNEEGMATDNEQGKD